ncbi:hypothetical protein HAX54_015017 [Datura stramonium]|uniref:Uncharacterized protein n=1 Tax=Datura stramonium TaxID=4076 RepID=A0ABS8RZ41_DATST|nr:hypothetical protein [Datura stramonium]
MSTFHDPDDGVALSRLSNGACSDLNDRKMDIAGVADEKKTNVSQFIGDDHPRDSSRRRPSAGTSTHMGREQRGYDGTIQCHLDDTSYCPTSSIKRH